MMPSIAIVNQHTNNYGDDAAGVALVERCFDELGADRVDVFYFRHEQSGGLQFFDERCVDHRLNLLAGGNGLGKRLAISLLRQFGRGSSQSNELSKLIEVCKSSDYVFVSPAGANIGVYKDWAYLLVLVALVLTGVRPIFMQNTIGASGSRLFDLVAHFVLRRSELSVREVRSHKWLADKGISSYLGVDTALLLDPLPIDNSSPGPTQRQPYIALVVTRLSRWNRSFEGFEDGSPWIELVATAVAASASRSNLDVEVVPHLYGANSERAYLEQVAGAVSRLGARVRLQDEGGLESYRTALANAEVVVSMRYHGLVLAAAAGTPCVSLAYENKMVEAAEYLGMPELSVPVGEVTAAELEGLISAGLSIDSSKTDSADRRQLLREIALGPIRAVQSGELRG